MRDFFNNKKAAIDLIAISFLSLFLELALIRFISSKVQVIAYFNNFLILSAFLGLGVGSILTDKKFNSFLVFPLIFALVIALQCVFGRFGSIVDLSENVIWTALRNDYPNIPVYIVIPIVFCFNFLFFVPLGNRLGQSLEKFKNRLIAYAFDLLGSIMGVACFTLMSYLQTGPYVWFSISGLVTLFLLGKNSKNIKYFLYILIGILVASIHEQGKWSPYYNVEWQPYNSYAEDSKEFLGYAILVDKVRIQDALKFSETLANHPELGHWIPYYRLPYHFRKPCKVLVLGGGVGNDQDQHT